ncbi:MAG: hypothetical protein ACI8W8_002893 [Rhodothermales bacterium]
MRKGLLFVGMIVGLGVGTATAAEGIYDADPEHLWNRLHQAFFLRGDLGDQNVDAVDPPLWPDTAEFLRAEPSLSAGIAVLTEFLDDDAQALITDPLKRAVLQQDLWAVFDWSAALKAPPDKRLVDLQSKLAAAIHELALSHAEIAELPNNLADAAAAGHFSADYKPARPQAPFLPRDLFDPDAAWVCIRGVMPGPSAPAHVEYYHGRSPFLVFISLPGGRAATLRYLNDLNETTRKSGSRDVSALPQFPVGTKAALLRQLTVIDKAGQIQTTALTQTLQMRVYRQVGEKVDHDKSQAAVKFRLSRQALFAGRNGGLEPIGWDEPIRVSLLNRNDIYDRDTKRTGIKTVMASCIACHSCGGATAHSIFTYKQDDWAPNGNLLPSNRLRLTATLPAQESRKTITWKTQRFEWGLLQGLMAARRR